MRDLKHRNLLQRLLVALLWLLSTVFHVALLLGLFLLVAAWAPRAMANENMDAATDRSLQIQPR